MTFSYRRLVLSGGGISGMAMLGSLSALSRVPGAPLSQVTTVVGTSVGSLVGAMFCVGVDMQTALEMVCAMDRRSLTSVSLDNILTTFGFDDGAGLDRFIEMFIPPDLTFATVQRVFKKRLVVHATSLTDQKNVAFDVRSAPNMPIARAIRMSCSIPLVYSTVRHEGKVYVDGGVIKSFAIETNDGDVPTLGIRIIFRKTRDAPLAINTLAEFMDALYGALVPDKPMRLPRHTHVIPIHTPVPASVLYDVTDAQLRELYRLGYVKALECIKKNA